MVISMSRSVTFLAERQTPLNGEEPQTQSGIRSCTGCSVSRDYASYRILPSDFCSYFQLISYLLVQTYCNVDGWSVAR
jgi:hypothetical protein